MKIVGRHYQIDRADVDNFIHGRLDRIGNISFFASEILYSYAHRVTLQGMTCNQLIFDELINKLCRTQSTVLHLIVILRAVEKFDMRISELVFHTCWCQPEPRLVVKAVCDEVSFNLSEFKSDLQVTYSFYTLSVQTRKTGHSIPVYSPAEASSCDRTGRRKERLLKRRCEEPYTHMDVITSKLVRSRDADGTRGGEEPVASSAAADTLCELICEQSSC